MKAYNHMLQIQNEVITITYVNHSSFHVIFLYVYMDCMQLVKAIYFTCWFERMYQSEIESLHLVHLHFTKQHLREDVKTLSRPLSGSDE